jgi:plastocyanin
MVCVLLVSGCSGAGGGGGGAEPTSDDFDDGVCGISHQSSGSLHAVMVGCGNKGGPGPALRGKVEGCETQDGGVIANWSPFGITAGSVTITIRDGGGKTLYEVTITKDSSPRSGGNWPDADVFMGTDNSHFDATAVRSGDIAGGFYVQLSCPMPGSGGPGPGPGPGPSGPPSTSSPPAPMTYDVSLAASAFDPATLALRVGDTVRWTHHGGQTVAHTVTSDAGVAPTFDSNPNCAAPGIPVSPLCMTDGETFEVTFSAPGSFGYHCKVHSGMKGTVVVA